MIDVKENELINIKLDTLYKKYTPDFLDEWQTAFDEIPPTRINQFGIINVHKYDRENGILFICRETNNWKDVDYAQGCLFREWMCDITKTGIAGKATPNMWYNIGRWAMLIDSPEMFIGEISQFKDEAIKYIGHIAFTNVNKVRGYTQSGKEYNRLANSFVVGEVLKREIETIKPRTIVCCGTGWIFDKYIQDFPGKVIYMPHPGARKSTASMLLALKKQID